MDVTIIGIIKKYVSSYVLSHFVQGTNISITENPDGTQTISASGEVSANDEVARESIATHIANENNPHNVTAEQIGLNDSTITIKKNGTTVGSFSTNNAQDKDINISVPTSAIDIGALPDTTKYAGSSTKGGSATSAQKLDNSKDAGSATQPIYFENGVPKATNYSVEKSVPSDAKFTDTTYTSKSAVSGGTTESLVTTGEKYNWNHKQDTLNFDAAPTNHSTNPVASGGIYNALQGKQDTIPTATLEQIVINKNEIIELVDSGAKNYINPKTAEGYVGQSSFPITKSGIQYTYSENAGTITLSETASGVSTLRIPVTLPAGTYHVSGVPVGGSDSTYRIDLRTPGGNTFIAPDYDYGSGFTFTISETTSMDVCIRVANGYSPNSVVIAPMICKLVAWNISHAFVPYRLFYDDMSKKVQETPAFWVGSREDYNLLSSDDYDIYFVKETNNTISVLDTV